MELHTDDQLYAIDNVFLGPPDSKNWPAIRYICYSVAGAAFAILMLLELRGGFLVTKTSLVYTAMASVIIAIYVGKWVDSERPFRTLPQTLVREINAPRASRPRSCVIQPPRFD